MSTDIGAGGRQPTSIRGLEEAIKLAKETRSQLRALFVVDEYALTTHLAGFADLDSILKIAQENGQRVLEDAKERATKQGVELQSVLIKSALAPVADTIVQQAQAWPADIIVMGTHGRRGFCRLMMGSDPHGVAQSTAVPVLLIRASGESGKLAST